MNGESQQVPEYVSAHTRASWSTYLLTGCLVINAVGLWFGFRVLDLVIRFQSGQKITQEELTTLNNQGLIVDRLTLLLMVSTAIVFLAWIYRTHKNLAALGARETQFTPGWAVFWFFIPILNLVRPFQIAEEIRAASNPEIVHPTAWKENIASGLVRGWWACYILSGFTTYIYLQGLRDLGHIAVWIGMAGSALAIVSAALGILMVRDIDNRQSAKQDRLRLMNNVPHGS